MPTSKRDFNELLAEKRRQAHVTMRALDSVLWEDPRDLAAAKVVAQTLERWTADWHRADRNHAATFDKRSQNSIVKRRCGLGQEPPTPNCWLKAPCPRTSRTGRWLPVTWLEAPRSETPHLKKRPSRGWANHFCKEGQ